MVPDAARLALALVITGVVAWLPEAPRAAGQQPAAIERAAAERTRSEKLAGENQMPAAIEAANSSAELLASVHGPNSLEVAEAKNWLGQLHFMSGDFAGAEQHMRATLAIRERLLKADDPLIAQSLNNVATVLGRRGDAVRAEELLIRALGIYRKSLGPDHLEVARALSNLARMYNERGDFDRAESHYLQALPIVEKSNENQVLLAQILNNIGILYQDRGDLARARDPLERSLKIRQSLLKPTDLQIAVAMGNLASVHQEQGALDAAVPLYERALEMYESGGAGAHPNASTLLNNLAMVWLLKGEYGKARPLYLRALETRRSRLGPTHPQVAKTLETLAVFHQVVGEQDDAVARITEAAEIVEANLKTVIAAGSEQQKAAYMSTVEENSDIALSLCRTLPQNSTCGRLAAEIVIRRKARVLDALMQTTAQLRARLEPGDQELLDQISGARAKLTSLLLSPGSRAVADDVKKLEADIQALEAAASARSAALLDHVRDVQLESIQEAIADDTAVIEFVRYRPFDPRAIGRDNRFGPPRYAAFLLQPSGPPRWFDLDDVASIDAQVAAWRSALVGMRDDDERRLGRALDERLLGGVPALNTVRRLVIVPDGALNLVPFAALIGVDQRYLVERYECIYLGSSRDLLQMRTVVKPGSNPVIVAAPAFGRPGTVERQSPAFVFDELAGAADEGARVSKLLPRSQLYVGAKATERLVKQLRSPAVLHLATHGFFLPRVPADVSQPTTGSTQRGLKTPVGWSDTVASRFALLRSGVALAGANHGKGEEDGILTALEAASLDLAGTQLVVLSACETGLGEIRTGDGVHGLRRALQIAGAQSQVMSLWRVSDAATRDLMIAYYEEIRNSVGRAAALRNVQLSMLKGSRQQPFYWASFIASGDWRPVSFN